MYQSSWFTLYAHTFGRDIQDILQNANAKVEQRRADLCQYGYDRKDTIKIVLWQSKADKQYSLGIFGKCEHDHQQPIQNGHKDKQSCGIPHQLYQTLFDNYVKPRFIEAQCAPAACAIIAISSDQPQIALANTDTDTDLARPMCQCQCGCRRRPGRNCRRWCQHCLRLVGPGCCWSGDDVGLCHICLPPDGNPQEQMI